MRRKIIESLKRWKTSPSRKPLLLYGARQVGKTYSALSFGRDYFTNVVYFNFEGNSQLQQIFDGNLSPSEILPALQAQAGETILPQETLIIFDEIQACERALTSLKYFCEEASEYAIIGAGSLLGVALNRKAFSFPVGKVDMMTLYPMDFEEFLWALGKEDMASLIRESLINRKPFSLHDTALSLYRLYLVVGGMPQAVGEYVQSKEFPFVESTLKNLDNAYIADMAKYTTSQETARIMDAWRSIPVQLAKENKKFQYKYIKSGARAGQYAAALAWLQTGGLILSCLNVTEGRLPLSVYVDAGTFKTYLMDTGLLCAKFSVPPQTVLYPSEILDGFRGALTENYCMQALVAQGILPYYWTSQGTAEVDFVFQTEKGNIVPLESKAASHVRAKSLHLFMKRYDIPLGIRVSTRNVGLENNIFSIPLYGLFALKDTLNFCSL